MESRTEISSELCYSTLRLTTISQLTKLPSSWWICWNGQLWQNTIRRLRRDSIIHDRGSWRTIPRMAGISMKMNSVSLCKVLIRKKNMSLQMLNNMICSWIDCFIGSSIRRLNQSMLMILRTWSREVDSSLNQVSSRTLSNGTSRTRMRSPWRNSNCLLLDKLSKFQNRRRNELINWFFI